MLVDCCRTFSLKVRTELEMREFEYYGGQDKLERLEKLRYYIEIRD